VTSLRKPREKGGAEETKKGEREKERKTWGCAGQLGEDRKRGGQLRLVWGSLGRVPSLCRKAIIGKGGLSG